MTITPPVLAASLAALLAVAGTAPASTAQPEPAAPLAGPSVDDTQPPTLLAPGMVRDFTPIEGRPELAAAALLNLDADTRDAIRQLEDDRATQLTELLVERIDDIRDITDLNTAGQTNEATQRLREIWIDLDGDDRRLPLRPMLADILTEPQLEETDRIANEYLAAWARSQGAADNNAQDRLAFQMFQQEVRRVYDASLGNTRRALEGIYDAVDPTPEQRAAIRDLVIDHIKQTRLQATTPQRRAVMRRIYDVLDEDRKGLLFDYTMRIVLPE